MGHGARINIKYLRDRTKRCKKCVVCGKALHPKNKRGLCSADGYKESNLNYYYSKIWKS